MAFDPKAYKKDVLVPLARERARSAQIDTAIRGLSQGKGEDALAELDLASLFAVDPTAPKDLGAHFTSLQASLNKWGRTPISADKVRLLLKAVREADIPVDSTAFWEEHVAQQKDARASAVKRFIDGLVQENPLLVMSPEALKQATRGTTVDDVPSSELEAAARRAGMTIAPEVTSPPVEVPKILVSAVEHHAFRTLADILLYPNHAVDVTFLDDLTSGGSTISVDHVTRAYAAAESARDSDAVQDAQKALGVLKKCHSQAEFQDVVRAAMLKRAADQVKPGGARVAQRDALVDAGINRVDAARTVLHLNPTGGSAPASASQLIGQALDEGDLARARRLAEDSHGGAADAAERVAVISRLESAETRKQDYLSQAAAAIERRDFSAADQALAEAAKIDAVDEDIPRRRAALPPARPDRLQVVSTADGVRLSWPTVVGDNVTYTVVRSGDAAPSRPDGGEAVGSAAGSTSATDTDAPVGTTTHYAVFATRDGHVFSDPATASITHLPSVSSLGATADEDRVSLTWSVPPQALGATVEIYSVGSPSAVHEVSTAAFTAENLHLGRRYTFVVRAIYTVHGTRAVSGPEQIVVTPRGRFVAPQDFAVEPLHVADGSMIRASWREVPGYDVAVWAMPLDFHPSVGSVLDLALLERSGGRRLFPRPDGQSVNGVTTHSFTIEGVSAFLPVTVDGRTGIPGEPVVSGSAPSVSEVRAERLGNAVRLSWVWPDGDLLVEIRWIQGDTPRTKRVTRAKYRLDGGVHLTPAHAIRSIEVATVVRGRDSEWTSPPKPAPFTSSPPAVRYSFAIRKGLFRAPTVTVTLDPGTFSGLLDLDLVLSTDSYMPSSARVGETLAHKALELIAGEPTSFEVELPRKIPSPFWLRLFASETAPVVLFDPPPSQMKG